MFQKPRGTRDFTSEEMQKRRHVEKRIRSTFISYAYTEIQTPTFETLELFTAKSGEEIIEELYSFKDKGSRNLALRPELTAPVIRFYVEKLQMEPKPIKLFYFGNCYRYDRPQKGRYREFTQAGCELIGTDTIEAVSELIALAYNIIKNVGVKDFKLNVGNLNILNLIFKRLNLKSEQKKYLIPLIDTEYYFSILQSPQPQTGQSIDCTADLSSSSSRTRRSTKALKACPHSGHNASTFSLFSFTIIFLPFLVYIGSPTLYFKQRYI